MRDGICRPVTFIPFDGTMQWRSGDDVIESGFSDVLAGREASRRYRTAISVELENGLPRILREAHERLLRVRRSGGTGTPAASSSPPTASTPPRSPRYCAR